MLPKRLSFPLYLALALVAFALFASQTTSSAAPTAAISLSSAYNQTFDSLANTGTSITWTNDTTISGWYSTRLIYNSGTGNTNTGSLYSFGAAASSERALGSVASGGTGTIYYGVRFVNDTGNPVTSLTIAYTGEQWRDGGNTPAVAQQLDFSYQIGATVTSLTTGTWTDANSLDFISPTFFPVVGVALNGNAAANRVVLSQVITINIPAGQEIMLRWGDINDANNDHGLGIDDLTVTAVSSPADTAPSVTGTTPTNGATAVAINADIAVNFSEDVTLDAGWYTVSCGTSGTHTAVVTGGPQNWTLNPDVDFANSETCNVTIDDVAVHDVDSNDPPDTMAADHLFSFTTAAATVTNDLRISQVYGGGGNSGATYTNDLIELFNAGTTTINLTGYSVQYASATGTSWQVTNLTGSLAPGQYYLVQEAAGGAGTTPLPTPDATGTIAMAAANGKVALVNTTTALTGGCPTTGVLDFVGYGTADCREGAAAAPAITNTNADFRLNNGCQDTNQNGNDFAANSAAPRNTQSPFYNCITGDFSPAVSSTVPTNGATNVALNADITLNFSEAVTLDTGWYTVSCATSGSHTATLTGGPQNWTLNPDADFVASETCTVTLTATAIHDVDANDPPDTMAANYIFNFATIDGTFGVCGDNTETPIHAIQGSGLTSSSAGATRIIEGIVIADYQDTALQMGGYYIQEEDADADANPNTSEGIYIFDNTTAVAVGDGVRLQGTVVEYIPATYTESLTEISPVSTAVICSSGNPLPTAIPVTLPVTAINDWERLEGMRVTVPQTLFVTEHYTLGRFGELLLSANDIQYQFTHNNSPSIPNYASYLTNFDLNTILLDDANTQQNRDPIMHPGTGLTAANTVRIGDTVAGLTGVVDHRYDEYRIQPVSQVNFTASNPRPAAPDNVGGTIWVGSFNVLNYFSTLDTGASICGPLSNQGCRGANSATEFTRQRDKIIQAIIALNADVIGLMEMENHASDAALNDLISGLNAVAGTGTYAKINYTPLGDDAIKVAIIYRPAWVTPIGSAMIDTNVIFDRPPLAQLFEVNTTGERFTVVVNHFKSKGCGSAAGADLDQLDGQGCYNDRRTQQANRLLTFINTVVVPTAGDSDVLIIGDLNAYALENPITTLTGGGFTNLLSSYLGTDTFSYIFNGQAGYLDHALASGTMAAQVTGVTHWGINGDEPITLDYNEDYKSAGQIISLYNADPYRSSDHSPVLIGLYPNDFSDLAGSYGTAWQTGGGALRLGTTWTADRTFGNNSDNGSDDGIARLPGAWIPGATVTIRATVTRSSGAAPAWLSCWIDWDNNGVFAAATERAVNTAVVVGVNDINLTIPLSTPSFTTLATRCRLYDSATEPFGPLATASSGAGTGGEVEDYNWGFSTTAITLSEMQVGNAAAPLRLFLVVLLLVVGNLWSWRRHIRLNNRTNQS